ncbi:hypothetical protein C7974DRAFT_387572 [Boeremia exigua]|uniref:uncharacterized protein n=1 Tax=Boeremia exigua TaxID=749465 RepID=UPI001E8DC111|nr:uncharacterized protein C7974DRAFT_387572 [Boeremia exigua]KAH6638934.1 hypothetical protein C7974DRAFT_387572 [Boeremia exigua]
MFVWRLFRMKRSVSGIPALNNVANPPKKEEARWPLSFKITPKQGLEAVGVSKTGKTPATRWWSHSLYRGPNDERVKILYSKTKAHSEVLAKQFLEEKVVGFDMEWPWDEFRRPDILQNKVGLIQVATEDTIALFHIGLHTGDTTDEILAPSLRKLIEDPKIGKLGVGILSADFARLHKFFKLDPKGAIELSHLHRLVTFGKRAPNQVSTKMTSLARQVEQHLGHPLFKGDVRKSNWSKPLSQEQIKYAAGDAYAGVMLYHYLNYQRLQMDPVPPMPIHADKYLGHGYKFGKIRSLYLEPAVEGGKIVTSAYFFGVPTAPADPYLGPKRSEAAFKTTPKSATDTRTPSDERPGTELILCKHPSGLPDETSQSHALYNELVKWRAARAARTNNWAKRIMTDANLRDLAHARPLDSSSFMAIQGFGEMKEKYYGKQVRNVIASFIARSGDAAPANTVDTPSTTSHPVTKGLIEGQEDSATSDGSSSPAFGTPPARAPQLPTGLSFILADTRLAESEDSDDSLPSIDFGLSPTSKSASGEKRKRSQSPAKQAAPDSPQMPQLKTRYEVSRPSVSHPSVSHPSVSHPSEPPLPGLSAVSIALAEFPAASEFGPLPLAQRETSESSVTPRSRRPRSSRKALAETLVSAEIEQLLSSPRESPPPPKTPAERLTEQEQSLLLLREKPESSAVPRPRRSSTRSPSSKTSPRAKAGPAAPSPTAEAPLPLQTRLFHNKLVAFSKLVATRRKTQASDLVSVKALEAIARNPPRSRSELRSRPGMEKLFLACKDEKMDLFTKVERFSSTGKPVNGTLKDA